MLKEDLDDPDTVINVIIGAYKYKPHTVAPEGVRGLNPGQSDPILQTTARDFIVPNGHDIDEVGVLILNLDAPRELVQPALLGEVLFKQLQSSSASCDVSKAATEDLTFAPYNCLIKVSFYHGVTTIAYHCKS